jgi:hypothetical protein
VDTSFRNKSANYAGLTNYIIADIKDGRLKPGACAISSDTTFSTYKIMFESVRSACQEKDPNWSPFCIMIDKCDVLFCRLLLKFFQNPVRLCQFHIAQIFLRLKISQDKVSIVFPCDFKVPSDLEKRKIEFFLKWAN